MTHTKRNDKKYPKCTDSCCRSLIAKTCFFVKIYKNSRLDKSKVLTKLENHVPQKITKKNYFHMYFQFLFCFLVLVKNHIHLINLKSR